MALLFYPKAGMILMCDFSGFRAPEMIKTRPVIIVSPNHLRRPGLCTVVPMSTTDPNPIEAYHHRFDVNPMPGSTGHAWVKCDMVVTVSVDRLDRIKVSRGNYVVRRVSNEVLEAIRQCMKQALGII